MGLGSFVPKMGRLMSRVGGSAFLDWYNGKYDDLDEYDKIRIANQKQLQKDMNFDTRMARFYGRDNWEMIREKRYPVLSYNLRQEAERQKQERRKKEQEFLKRNKEYLREILK